MFSPGAISFVISTQSFCRDVYSIITTASAPCGTGAPVMMENASPRFSAGWDLAGHRARFDLSYHGQLGWKSLQIGGMHGIAIARGSRKGRNVAIGDDGLSKDSAGGVEQGYVFVCAWGQPRTVVLDNAACVFKG
jgi:hypothetical protein